ncbi:unnamed protein product [Prorocentrum cordatum]|uniref:Uncharacterized protein n=1 Tax=Prorocentrum cordatum TaxID=2364126 RepID=A0ABN9WTJ0_9DINO|nr:unnamed protein product [Polarella glacialis]
MRDISHSSLQFPLYEGIKLAVARQTGKRSVDCLPAWQVSTSTEYEWKVASRANSDTTAATPTLIVGRVRTRVNLCSAVAKSTTDAGIDRRTLATTEIRTIYRQRGLLSRPAPAVHARSVAILECPRMIGSEMLFLKAVRIRIQRFDAIIPSALQNAFALSSFVAVLSATRWCRVFSSLF